MSGVIGGFPSCDKPICVGEIMSFENTIISLILHIRLLFNSLIGVVFRGSSLEEIIFLFNQIRSTKRKSILRNPVN